ncbi:MAG: FtsX-like permease family protein [Candidatus Promineifilaceae bacterium]|nr:FtsX-like permease family protein [Candidatus Promineifilaceae bacterium]
MILKYVLKNFSRRKVRTILMILSLIVSTGLIVTMSATVESVRQSNVDLIASEVGQYDLTLSKVDTSLLPFIPIEETMATVIAADERITAVYPRIEADVEIGRGGEIGRGILLALDTARDDIGYIDVISGTYSLEDGKAAVLEETALNFGLEVGDEIDVAYSYPTPREEGLPVSNAASQRRVAHRYAVGSIVRQDGVASGAVRSGLIVDLAGAQEWLGLEDQAQLLVATVDPGLYETNNAEVAALRVREVAAAVQDRLGDEFTFSLGKAAALDGAAQAFLAIQALINIYGLMALGVVGLLVYTLVMTNVQEQRRDMAVLRILGGQRNFLFTLVIVEVLVIGVIGVGFGLLFGQLITRFVAVPLIQQQMMNEGITSSLTPQVSLATLLPIILIAFLVLITASIKPARIASQTKVVHAINPGMADNIQLEDLASLRERNPNRRLFLAGLALMFVFALIAGFQVVETFGGPALQVSFILLALGLLVLGLGLMFFILTVPFEKLIFLVMGLIFPRLTYFARRNVGRGQLRNTLISLLVLFSGVLPSFLATQMALDNANFETRAKLNMGAPVTINVFRRWDAPDDPDQYRLKPSFLENELTAIEEFEHRVGLTYAFSSQAADPIGLRSAQVQVVGVDGRLNDVLFEDMIEFADDPQAPDLIQDDARAVIISSGLSEHLALSQGDTIYLTGEGLDHIHKARIAGIAHRLPGFQDIGRSRTRAVLNSTVLMSLDGFRDLTTELNQPLPPEDSPVLERIMATLVPEASAEDVSREMGERFGSEHNFWSRFLETRLELNRREQGSQRVFLLVLTVISFTTAVFGVFAVIYVTIYARRIEVGMMKAMGMRRRELTGMLILESIAITLGAALAGITAGAAMAYVSSWGEYALSERPMIFALDNTVMPFIVIMVVLASIFGAAFSARRIVKKPAVEILRMQ